MAEHNRWYVGEIPTGRCQGSVWLPELTKHQTKTLLRVFLLVLMVICTFAAEHEKITLKDGRVLFGYYDEFDRELKTSGSVAATIKVAPWEIIAREPAPVPVASPAKQGLSLPTEVTKPAIPPAVREYIAASDQFRQAQDAAVKAQNVMAKARAAALQEFFFQAIKTPAPAVISDPGNSAQLAQQALVNQYNRWILTAGVHDRRLPAQFAAIYASLHGMPWVLNLAD